jgi:hypothetical protein
MATSNVSRAGNADSGPLRDQRPEKRIAREPLPDPSRLRVQVEQPANALANQRDRLRKAASDRDNELVSFSRRDPHDAAHAADADRPPIFAIFHRLDAPNRARSEKRNERFPIERSAIRKPDRGLLSA